MQEAFIDMNHRVKSLECEVERLKRIMDSLVAEWTSQERCAEDYNSGFSGVLTEAGPMALVPDYNSVPPQKTTLCSVRFTESHEGGAFEFGTCGHGEAQAGKEPADGLQE